VTDTTTGAAAGTQRLHVLRVFIDADGSHGNPLGVFLEGARIPPAARRTIAADLGFSETVFVDDAAEGRYRIFTPAAELRFAGHPTVGTAWLLERVGVPASTVRPPAGDVATWQDADLRWIRARPEWVHPIHVDELPSEADVDALPGPPSGDGSYYAWAWIDEPEGVIRSRYFVPTFGIGEDEATGAAAVVMGSRLGRPIRIHQGRGSVLVARPAPDGTVEVGGRCVLDEVRDYMPPWTSGRGEDRPLSEGDRQPT
jgi:predicted PhzF superfamily epimerase YddE/YHI9